MQIIKRDGSEISGWFTETGLTTPIQPGSVQYRLSGKVMRDELYFATAPGNQLLYVALKKNGIVTQLPVV
jgi:hypothetical protein